MKKQEMHPEKDKHQTQDKSSKTKPHMEEKINQKSPRSQDSDEEDDISDDERHTSERDTNREQSNDKKPRL